MKLKLIISIFFIVYALINSNGYAQSKFKDMFVDSTDNSFDISNWMLNYNGFFPLFTIITEPAVDNGIGGGFLFLNHDEAALKEGKHVAPTIYGIGGMYTGNNSWGLGAFYSGVWKQDHIRYTGAMVYSSINLNYYRTIFTGDEIKLSFNLEGLFFLQELAFRIKESRYFIGGRYSYFNYTATFKLPELPIDIPDPERDASIGGIGPIIYFDTRDFTLTPNKGIRWYLKYVYQDNWLGSDFKYSRIDAYGIGFIDKIPRLILGFRADFRFIWDDYPFFTQPFVTLRGIPAMRYQDKIVTVLETEERWDFTRRWSLVGFAGIGKAFSNEQAFKDYTTAWSLGTGIRYKLARLLNIYWGVDIARGNEEWAFYLQFGHYWNGL
jgi:hypothetical protein